MKKTKIIVSLAVTAAIALTGICAFAKTESNKENGEKSAFRMGRHMKFERPELTEEQKAELKAKFESGEFKGKKFEKKERPELTEEQKAEMEAKKAERLEEVKAKLSEKLASGEITKEQYDEILAKLESGELKGFMGMGRGKGKGPMMNNKPEKKAEFKSGEFKGKNSEKRERPELTEEQKAEMKAKFESGKFKCPMGKGMGKKEKKAE